MLERSGLVWVGKTLDMSHILRPFRGAKVARRPGWVTSRSRLFASRTTQELSVRRVGAAQCCYRISQESPLGGDPSGCEWGSDAKLFTTEPHRVRGGGLSSDSE